MTLFVCVFPFSLSSACGAVFELVNLALNRTLPYHNITRSVGPFGRSDEAALAAKLAARSLGFSSAFCRLESSQCIVEDLLGSDSSYVNILPFSLTHSTMLTGVFRSIVASHFAPTVSFLNLSLNSLLNFTQAQSAFIKRFHVTLNNNDV